MKKIIRARFKNNDDIVITAMRKYYMDWCVDEKCVSPVYMSSVLNCDYYSLVDAMRDVYPNVKGYEKYTAAQWCAFLSLYDDPIFKECQNILKDYI